MHIGSGKIERLTKRDLDGGISVTDLSAALEKLAELEDAEQDGRLAIFPVRVGQTVHRNRRTFYGTLVTQAWSVAAIVLDGTGVRIRLQKRFGSALDFLSVSPDDFGKRVWIEKADAEVVAKERNEREARCEKPT